MKTFYPGIFAFLLTVTLLSTACSSTQTLSSTAAPTAIDLSYWKVTIPTPGPKGTPIEVAPPAILDYANVEVLQKFMYPDPSDGSIVFYAYPASSTANSKYSRTELREQMEPGSNHRNWTFKEGGRMKVTMSVPEVSRDDAGKEHRMIIAQIHGRLTNEQRDRIGQKDNNAPPVLKIYYDKGKIRVKTKVLKNKKATDQEILHTDAWTDDEGYTFDIPVDQQKFTLEIIASEGRLEVKLNGFQKATYKSDDMERWGIFENYFKVGNYLQSRDPGAFGKVKIYALEVSH